MYMPFFYDPTAILLIPAIIIAIYAQVKVKSTFNKFNKIRSQSGYSGAEIARKILISSGIDDVSVNQIQGHLTDHYDPRKKVLNLSPEVYSGRSLAALGVAAHEAGHAIQDARDYKPMRIRASLVPAASIGSSWGLPLAVFGFFMQSRFMIGLGLIVFTAAVLFHIVTLPVEFNASNRAIQILNRGFLSKEELNGAKKVLRAAAFTYVAATLVAIINLLRILILFGMGRDE
ncbi:zinc metallopeptidase [Halothermothrix orenii]|uniref:Peptidase membrane zinc metallopeptidase putative n=1 Tax=Halothermothrix orenii (strain H 168 / OCM 544 / DSM 9562) TaxID=373903 RepID=B8CWS8_HALOH|nr:zinc metallopeptidase [Halothermothrix orenii]ACL69747.1 peptidase membrane zinc metallopeptidase putative [Halothermothrix orenii H 168]